MHLVKHQSFEDFKVQSQLQQLQDNQSYNCKSPGWAIVS